MNGIPLSRPDRQASSAGVLTPTWVVLLRQVPVGLVGCVLILALACALGLSMIHGSRAGPGLPAVLAPAVVAALAQGFAAALIGSGVAEISGRLRHLRVPGAERRVRRAAALLWLLLWLTPAALGLALPTQGQGWWLWPLGAALGAVTIGASALLVLSANRQAWGWTCIAVVITLSATAPRLGPLLAKLPAASFGWRLGVALASLFALAAVAAAMLAWMRRPETAPTRLAAAGSSSEGQAAWASAGSSTFEASSLSAAPPASALDLLVMPRSERSRRADLGTALFVAVLYGMALHLWVADPELPLLVALAWAASLDGTVQARGCGLSPRSLLVPGGLHRPDLLARVFTMTCRRTWRRTLVLALPALAILCVATNVPLTAMAALIPALAGAWLWGCALGAGLTGVAPLLRHLAAGVPGLLLMGSAYWLPETLASAPAFASATPDAGTWLAWSLGTGLLAGLLATLTLWACAGRVRRLDGRRLEAQREASVPG